MLDSEMIYVDMAIQYAITSFIFLLNEVQGIK
jgi:hypothetical protein